MNLAEFLAAAKLAGVKKSGNGWVARCPAHEDGKPSLSITEGREGRVLLHCHAGCSVEAICARLGIQTKDLMPDLPNATPISKPRIVASYNYTDEADQVLFQVVRFEPKDFRQRRPDPSAKDGWDWSVKGVRKVPYRLPDLLLAVKCGERVWIVEGEKDANAMKCHGLFATCNAGGAGKWLPEFAQYFNGAAVVILADKDEPGRKHAGQVAASLLGKAQTVRVIEVPDANGAPCKDAADFLAAGATADELRALADAASEWMPNAPTVQTNSVASEYLSDPGDNRPSEDDAEIARLAALPPLEYERQREDAANKLGCRTSILDKLVDVRRPKPGSADGELQGRSLNLPEVELWPDGVNGAAVLAEVAETFYRYVALPDGAADALALWCAHTHCFDSFTCTPRLHATSPDKGCGKSTLRDVLATLVPRPLPTENLSAAVLFRITQSHRPTLLADECDRYLQDNDELLAMLNAGHRRGGQALRCEGESNEVRAFSVFAPAVLCGIGALPGTLHDRSIIVKLQRAKPGEVRERFDSRRTEREQELCRKLSRFAADSRARIAACDPALPSGAFNRAADNWRPLFAIAEIAGGDWPQRATAAFAKLTSREDPDAQGIGMMLLADVRQAFTNAGADRMFSSALVAALCEMTERTWPEAHRGKAITETWLARRLKSFGVHSRKLRLPGEPPKQGYYVEDFGEAFQRYLPESGESKWNTGTTLENRGDAPRLEVEQPIPAFHFEKSVLANEDAGCSTVPLGKTEPAEMLL